MQKSKKYKNRYIGAVLTLLVCLVGCSVKVSKEVIPPEKLKEVLYDYHLAKSYSEDLPYSDYYKRALYEEAVFHKHNITKSEFDSTMRWYSHNAELLSKVYKDVSERYRNEKAVVDTLIAKRENRPLESQPGDSIDVWAWPRVYELYTTALNNKLAFTLPSDTNFKERDTLKWILDYRSPSNKIDSLYPILASLHMKFENDSTVSTYQLLSMEGRDTLTLYSDSLWTLREVKGWLYLPVIPDSVHKLLINEVLLYRYHATDSIATPVQDELEKTDVLLPEQEESKNTKKQETESIAPAGRDPRALRDQGVQRVQNTDKITPQKIQKQEILKVNE